MDNKNADMIFQKGQLIGQYKISETLKQEQFANIYLVTSIFSKTPAVIKVLRPPLISELQKDFLTQARMLIEMEHPHILRLRDAGVESHYPFLLTDYVPHLTLRQVFLPGSIQPLAKFLPYLKQIASALQYAHNKHVIHGNIQPENILLNRDNQILLSDFSMDAIMQNQERLNYLRTAAIAYAAPEMVQGKAEPASDQYSLAIVVYELLTGEVPFTKSYAETAHQQMNSLPPSMREKVQDIPSKIDKIVMTALAKDPARRFTNIQAFVNALEQAQYSQSRGSTSYRTSPPPVVPQPVRPPTAVPVSPIVATPIQPLTSGQVLASSFIPASLPQVQRPTTPAPLTPPVTPPPMFEDSPPAPRPGGKNTITRRAFAFGLIGLAVAGGAGGWYTLSQRLAKAAPLTASSNDIPPATRTTINNMSVLIFTGHLASVNAVTWSPDGKLIASASDDAYVQIFDASSGKRKLIFSGHTEEVAAVSWSPNGKLIASGSQDKTAQVWNASNGKKILVYKGHGDRVDAVSWSSDSQQIASGSDDKTVQVWNATGGALNFNFQGHTAGVLSVGWQPGNSSVASSSWDGTLRDWATVQHGDHFNAGDQIFSYSGHGKNEVYALAWSPDGNFIVSAGADQTVQISNGNDGTPRPPFFTGHRSTQRVNPVRSVAWSPDGDFIASGDTNGIVYVWRVSGRKTVFTYRGHKGAVNALAWSPDGKSIASASADNTVHVWQPS